VTAAPEGPEARTERLDLYRPTADDVAAVSAICSDPRVWTHFPSKRHTDPSETARAVARWASGWATNGLDAWVARERGTDAVLGYGGCGLREDAFWNLGYRLAPTAQGRGYATELARAALDRALAADPDLPVVASLLAHDAASEAVARRLGMTLAHRGPDAGNPDPTAVRLVYADRPLSGDRLAAAMR
jgi:RimJ/RimL family protein N-acetyltransferase